MPGIIESIEEIDNVVKSVIAIDILLRNGNVVSAYRQGLQTLDDIRDDYSRKIISRAVLRMRKGEQIDALNDIKSLADILKNEKRKILTNFVNSIVK
jgi:hypothetical protein